jgi:hypothetical protein
MSEKAGNAILSKLWAAGDLIWLGSIQLLV